jgi:primosomal protein N' (replication factor Y)
MLYSSDLRSLERAYQTITQVIGRAGRRKDEGQIIIQTFNPQNILFEKISQDNKNEFYDFELKNRRQQNLPPFSQMARFEISSLQENLAKNFAKNFLKLFPINDKIEIFGPAPAPLQKLKNRHHFLIHLRVDKKVNLQKLINDITFDLKVPSAIRIRININPY